MKGSFNAPFFYAELHPYIDGKKQTNRNLPNDLFKPKHSVRELFVRSFGTHFRIV